MIVYSLSELEYQGQFSIEVCIAVNCDNIYDYTFHARITANEEKGAKEWNYLS